MADFYEILGVPKSAAASDIRQAYVRLAKERHPDRFTDPAQKAAAQSFFQDLTTAFNTLFNERTRAEYDQESERKKPVTPEELAQDSYERALALAESGGSPEEALDLLRAAAHHQPNEAKYHATLGRFLAKRATFAREAIQSLERATQLSPQTAAFFADLALLLHKQGMKLRAQKAAEQALRLAPKDAHVQKVSTLVGQG
jgi:curved DNA-binding protein CbpA